MSGDLLVITPSRSRPQGVARLLEAVHHTKRLNTHVCIAIDDDDPELNQYRKVFDKLAQDGDVLEEGTRKGLASWTNDVAAKQASSYRYLASFGDDMVPRSQAWDWILVRAIEDMGGIGFTYPWDGITEFIPEAVVISSKIVQALGWMCEPSLEHYYIDDVWADLGRAAGCLRHLRTVSVEHMHPGVGKAAADSTYATSSEKISSDHLSYLKWRSGRMLEDIKTVVSLRELGEY